MAESARGTGVTAGAIGGIIADPVASVAEAVGDITADHVAVAVGVRGVSGKPRCC